MRSDDIKELTAALSKAQSQITGAIKNSKNPHYKSTFANLESVWDAIREPLFENGLAIYQTTDIINGDFVLITTLAHTSGQFMSGKYILDPVRKDPQGYGSAVTYARRYALSAIVGLYQVDDDGQMASEDTKDKVVKKVVNNPAAYNPPPENYVFTFGKDKGKALKDFDSEYLKNKLMQIIDYLQKNPNNVGMKEAATNIELVLAGKIN